MEALPPPSSPLVDDSTDYSWSSSNVTYAILISIGAGLATAIGGCIAFVPSLLNRVSPGAILSIALRCAVLVPCKARSHRAQLRARLAASRPA